jgi:hypothetical protein
MLSIARTFGALAQSASPPAQPPHRRWGGWCNFDLNIPRVALTEAPPIHRNAPLRAGGRPPKGGAGHGSAKTHRPPQPTTTKGGGAARLGRSTPHRRYAGGVGAVNPLPA